MSEATTVDATQAEAGAQVARLYEKHSRMVVGLCRLLVRDPHEAEDAAQQTFLSAYQHLKNFRGDAAFGSWVHRIAANHALTRASVLKSGRNRSPVLTSRKIPITPAT